MLIVGLTGGIATGKSTVARRLKELGTRLIDADHLAREVVEPGEPAFEEIRARFGPEVIGPDGRIDRARLGEIIFRDEKAREDLESIIHPRAAKDPDDDRTSTPRRRRLRDRLRHPAAFETGAALEWVE